MDLVRSLLERAPFEFIDHKQARVMYGEFRGQHGAAPVATPLLTAPDENTKFRKTRTKVYGLSLAPADLSGVNACRFSTPECRAGCVAFAGRGELSGVIAGRVRKTQFLNEQPAAFLTLLMFEIAKAYERHGLDLRVRLNTFSDIPWERVCPELFERFPLVRFYDYTKWPTRETPSNYTLTRSVSERTYDAEILLHATHGGNQAVVFGVPRTKLLPTSYMGVRVIDGDASDDRSGDPRGVIVGLRAKGRMRKGAWGTVRQLEA